MLSVLWYLIGPSQASISLVSDWSIVCLQFIDIRLAHRKLSILWYLKGPLRFDCNLNLWHQEYIPYKPSLDDTSWVNLH